MYSSGIKDTATLNRIVTEYKRGGLRGTMGPMGPPGPPGGVVSTLHSDLTDLTTSDDHTQYVNKNGRAGGQTIYGGTVTSQGINIYANSVDNSGLITVNGSRVMPLVDNITALGDTSKRFQSIYSTYAISSTIYGGIAASTNLTLDSSYDAAKGNIILKSTMRPNVTDSFNLGTSAFRFDTFYTRTIQCPSLVGTNTPSGNLDIFSSWAAPRDGNITMYCGTIKPATTDTTNLGAFDSQFLTTYTKLLNCPTISGANSSGGDLRLYSSWGLPRNGSIIIDCRNIKPATTDTTSLGTFDSQFLSTYTKLLNCPTISGANSSGGDLSLCSSSALPRTGSIIMDCGSIMPKTNIATHIGSSANKFGNIYSANIISASIWGAVWSGGDLALSSTSATTKGSIIVDSVIRPSVTLTTGLGTYDKQFTAVYANGGYFTTITAGSTSGVDLTLRSTVSASKGRVYLPETTDSTSISTGSFVTEGGAAIAKNLYVGGTLFCNSIANSLNDDMTQKDTLKEDFYTDALDSKWVTSTTDGTVLVDNATVGTICSMKTTADYGYATVRSKKFVNILTQAFEIETRVKGTDVTGGNHCFGLQQDNGLDTMSLWIDRVSGAVATNWCVTILDCSDNQALSQYPMQLPRTYTANEWVFWKIVSDKTNINIYSKTSVTGNWYKNHTIPVSQFNNANAQMTKAVLYMGSAKQTNAEIQVDYVKFSSDRV